MDGLLPPPCLSHNQGHPVIHSFAVAFLPLGVDAVVLHVLGVIEAHGHGALLPQHPQGRRARDVLCVVTDGWTLLAQPARRVHERVAPSTYPHLERRELLPRAEALLQGGRAGAARELLHGRRELCGYVRPWWTVRSQANPTRTGLHLDMGSLTSVTTDSAPLG